jgi:ADP-ribose pyrophosphatase YjhB (NUDIX family)
MLVHESLDDVLKPKSREEVEHLEKDAIERTEGLLGWVEDELEYLESEPRTTPYWNDRLTQVHIRILEALFELPEYLSLRYEKRVDDLHVRIDALMGIQRDRYKRIKSIDEDFKPNITSSAGLVIIQDNKILLEHPTNSAWFGTYSIPKGHIEESDEDILDAALRETREEIGIIIALKDIISGPHVINYQNKGNIYKQIHYYVVEPSAPILKSDFNLQKAEVDWAGFLTKEEASKRIFWRLNKVLDHLK